MTSFVPRQFPVDFLRLDAALRQTLNELEKQQKQQRNAAMVTCRKTKKEKQKRNHSELHHLESQLQHLVESVRVARSSQEQNANETPAEALHGLVADLKLLRLENLALREEIQRYETLRVMLDSEQFREELSQHMTSLWHVGVDQNLPCFHFSRFTRDEVDEAMNQFDLELALSAPALSYAGEFLGWSVHHAPLDVYPSGSTIARVHCHLTLPLVCPVQSRNT
ncbi:hypothetical protein P3T76_007255 [Phytophthora citrophthora]|uniref:BZIP domain-containing protein n=1 Tax=Phytophthora citrophthora TaxID=4793 RepID=A0AAD9GMZ7_9STRA|nr:hypothetical protein P3T76_007255 [Phytophthora citrophthora]